MTSILCFTFPENGPKIHIYLNGQFIPIYFPPEVFRPAYRSGYSYQKNFTSNFNQAP